MLRYYIFLSLAILLEIVGAGFMKLSKGFTEPGATIVVIAAYSLALTFYVLLTNRHGLGIINALWAGVGTVIVSAGGIILFQESVSLFKITGILFIVAGVLGLNLPKQRRHTRKVVY
ncbi:DMT family transporter [Salibacterium halotolerans]|uniref:Small multidrug resistance pump n=1 Tax=Salibacterium halotolerans TaxID=1884432 RepID=A0A1I5LJ48_9BACI|nr:SMR family transporter [Salibacterium halotolerans]SFO96856.1 small multidrug resistance pump [Salibacterium halotolerans]